MNNLSGFNSQEIRRLHPYLSALLSRLKALETKVGAGGEVVWGTDEDILPTANANLAGILNKFARVDHQHLFKFPTALPLSTPDGTAFFDLSASAINIYVGDTPTTRVVAGGTAGDVQPTGRSNTGTVPRYSYADHSHPTALLPQGNPQPPVEGEIRYNADDKLVRWDGSEWVKVSVEEVEAGVDADVRPTKLLSAGQSPRFAKADHSHPTAILAQSDTQLPEIDEIRYTADNKIVRWNATEGEWVALSVETFTIDWGTDDDVQPTRTAGAGTSALVARADHSHPTAILPEDDPQTPVSDEIRYNANGRLVRWDGSGWVEVSVEEVEAGTDDDVEPTKLQSAGSSTRFARADHSHPTAVLPEEDPQTPVVDEIRYTADNKVIRWDGSAWVPLSVETFTIEWGANDDVQPTKLKEAGASTRFARADHSHPTAILPQNDPQTPEIDEIRYDTDDKLVRWDGNEWVSLSVEEAGGVDWGTNNDVQPTGLKNEGTAPRVARADHSHPTAILHEDNPQPPVADEIRYNEANNLVRWNGDEWVEMSVVYFEAGQTSDVQPTRLRSAGTSFRYARANHSHPTALLPQSDSQTPVIDEIRYTPTNKLVRWIGSTWVDFISGFPVPADPLILPFSGDVDSPLNRQLVNHSSWDNIGNATIFYYDSSNLQYRLAFTRPLVVSTTSTPSGKDVWSSTANELVLKRGAGSFVGSVLWNRIGNTTNWSPVAPQLSDDTSIVFPTDVGVLTRSPLTGTSGSRRWFIRGVQEDGSFRAPFVGFASFASADTPTPANLATNLNDGYAYYIHDLDRVDIVKPTTNGNKHPTMLSHSIIAPLCRILSTETDPSGHYVKDIVWNSIWGIGFFTTTSANTNLIATLPTLAIPYGLGAGRVLLYLHNPQSSAITTVFALLVRTLTSTGIQDALSSFTTINIPANTTVVADMGHISFPPSTTLSHHRSYPISLIIIRRRVDEAPNNNTVYCLGAIIVPQRSA